MKKSQRQRRPKGLGTIRMLGQNRARPYQAIIEGAGSSIDGSRRRYTMGTFATYEQAEKCLDIYFLKFLNVMPAIVMDKPAYEDQYLQFVREMAQKGIMASDPRDIDNADIVNQIFLARLAKEGIELRDVKPISTAPTLAEIWERVKDTGLRKMQGTPTLRNYDTAFKHLHPIHSMPIDTLTMKDIQPIFDHQMCDHSSYAKMNLMKVVLNHCFKYAIKYDLASTNYAQYIDFYDSREEVETRQPFDDDTIRQLWTLRDDPDAQAVLVMIYTGMRPGEFATIRKDHVHLEERYMIGGIKTAAGKDRVIPIHESIAPFIAQMLQYSRNAWLFGDGRYKVYLVNSFHVIRDKLHFTNTPHSCRHTFATLAKLARMDEYARKKIMGHACKDLTDDVYTHAPIAYLVKQVNLIRTP